MTGRLFPSSSVSQQRTQARRAPKSTALILLLCASLLGAQAQQEAPNAPTAAADACSIAADASGTAFHPDATKPGDSAFE